jgi:hypothetical protein
LRASRSLQLKLTAPLRHRFPGGDRLIRKPHRQTAPLPQRLVIRRPIRHASLRPRNMVATVGIVFVRHEGKIRSIETDRLLPHPAHPCNTLSLHHHPPGINFNSNAYNISGAWRSYTSREFLACPVEKAHERAHRDVQSAGCIPVAQAIKAHEYNGRAQLVR